MGNIRSMARERALQAIYQWQLSGNALTDIESYFDTEQGMKRVDKAYFHDLLHGIPKHLTEIDSHSATYIDRPFEQIDPVEQAILRIGTYELAFRQDIPYRVVLNEAVHLAKRFGSEQSHRYINGILDRIAWQVRSVEMKAARKQEPV